MNPIHDHPHLNNSEVEGNIVGVSKDLIAKVLDNFNDITMPATEFVETIFWKLWIRYLAQIRLPNDSIETNCRSYLKASQRANEILRKLFNVISSPIAYNYDFKETEEVTIAKELLNNVVQNMLTDKVVPIKKDALPYKEEYNLADKENKTINRKPFKYNKKLISSVNTKAVQKSKLFVAVKRKQKSNCSNYTGTKRGRFGQNYTKQKEKKKYIKIIANNKIPLVTSKQEEKPELVTVEELDFEKVVDPNYKKRSNYAILKLTEEAARKCSNIFVATPLQAYKADKEYMESASKDVGELLDKGLCLIASTEKVRRTLQGFSLNEN